MEQGSVHICTSTVLGLIAVYIKGLHSYSPGDKTVRLLALFKCYSEGSHFLIHSVFFVSKGNLFDVYLIPVVR